MPHSRTSIFRILLIEDNPVDIELTRRAFGRSDLQVQFTVAQDGEEATNLLETWGQGTALPNLILLDLKLPKVNGFQVLKALKQHGTFRNIPVVVLTSSAETRDIQEAYQLGANSYIVKQIDFDDFLKAAGLIEEYWGYLNETPSDIKG